jgi:hypothetical protein
MAANSGERLTQMPCMPCNGRGYNSCGVCSGIGHRFMPKSRLRYDGTIEFYQERVACTSCFGTGRSMCLSCKGVGWVLQSGAPSSPVAPQSIPSVRPPDSSTPFPFQAYQFVYHPTDQNVWACWQYDPGNCLDVGVPSGGNIRIELVACQTNMWLSVQDGSGGPVPLSIFVSPSGLLGRWL